MKKLTYFKSGKEDRYLFEKRIKQKSLHKWEKMLIKKVENRINCSYIKFKNGYSKSGLRRTIAQNLDDAPMCFTEIFLA